MIFKLMWKKAQTRKVEEVRRPQEPLLVGYCSPPLPLCSHAEPLLHLPQSWMCTLQVLFTAGSQSPIVSLKILRNIDWILLWKQTLNIVILMTFGYFHFKSKKTFSLSNFLCLATATLLCCWWISMVCKWCGGWDAWAADRCQISALFSGRTAS